MIVAIHQPQYLPWLPYCDKAMSCDVFVYLDTVQFQKNGVQNRNQIKTAQGAQWLTVPVSARLGESLDAVAPADPQWFRKHQRTLRQSYSRAPHVGRLGDLEAIISRPFSSLAELNIAVMEWIFDQLGSDVRRVRASELGADGQKDELVRAICRSLGATAYLSGTGARVYQTPGDFLADGIHLRYQRYRHPTYPQQHAKLGFLADLSVIDLILNTGPDAGDILRSGRLEWEEAS